MTRPATTEEIAISLGKASKTSSGWKCLCPLHDDSNPSMLIHDVGEKDGKPWASCQSCGTGPELYKAIENKTGLHFSGRELKRKEETAEPGRIADKKSKPRRECIYPAPPGEIFHPPAVQGVLPSQLWEYLNDKDEVMFIQARYDLPAGKTFRQYSWGIRNSRPQWLAKNELKNRPMYNLRQVIDNPYAKVLIVEGEKTADYARALPEFKEHVVVTWSQGGKSWHKTDWSPLKNREVYAWPDADPEGVQSIIGLGKHLWTIAEHVTLAELPRALFQTKGWDLADAWPDGLSLVNIRWKNAPKPDRPHMLKSIGEDNYQEVFESLYYVYHDGAKTYTVSKEFIKKHTGLPIKVESTMFRMMANGHHEAWSSHKIEISKGNYVSALKLWIDHKMQLGEFISTFDFRPDIKDAVIDKDAYRVLNTFTGFPYKPDLTGSCDLFKTFILEIICNNDIKSYSYLWNFLSHMIQYPAEKPNVAILMRGNKGTGKSFFMTMIQKLLGGVDGYGNMVASSQVFKNQFNGSYAASSLAMFIHEWQIYKSTTIENVIKSFITDETVDVNIKYMANYQARSYTRVFGASNHDRLVNASGDERRYSIFDISDDRINDHEYFKSLLSELENGGLQRLMYELGETKVEKHLTRTILQTKALDEQKQMSKAPAQAFAEAMLVKGEFWLKVLDESRDVEMFHHITQETWEKGGMFVPQGLAKRVIDEQFTGRFEESYSFKSPKASVKGAFSWMTEDWIRGYARITMHGSQKDVGAYKLPSLKECRNYYATKTGLEYDDLFGDDRTIINLDEKRRELDQDVPF